MTHFNYDVNIWLIILFWLQSSPFCSVCFSFVVGFEVLKEWKQVFDVKKVEASFGGRFQNGGRFLRSKKVGAGFKMDAGF